MTFFISIYIIGSQGFMKNDEPELPAPRVFTSVAALMQSNSFAEQAQKRRSSSRSIKRKKFDDELVESSLIKTSRVKPQSASFPLISPSVSSSNIAATPTASSSTSTAQTDTIPSVIVDKKKVVVS